MYMNNFTCISSMRAKLFQHNVVKAVHMVHKLDKINAVFLYEQDKQMINRALYITCVCRNIGSFYHFYIINDTEPLIVESGSLYLCILYYL